MSAKSVLHPLELMTVLIIYGIDNKVRVYMPLVYMRGYQNFIEKSQQKKNSTDLQGAILFQILFQIYMYHNSIPLSCFGLLGSELVCWEYSFKAPRVEGFSPFPTSSSCFSFVLRILIFLTTRFL